MHYVDGFVIPVPENRLADYKKMAKMASKVWCEHGALEYRECVADDVPYGKTTSFPRSVKIKSGETVIFAWIVYKSRAHRDRVNSKAMQDPRMQKFMDKIGIPFDGKRMIFGGFDMIVKRDG